MAPPRLQLAGQRFGSLVAVRPTGETGPAGVEWECVCDCGRVVRTTAGILRAGQKRFCGRSCSCSPVRPVEEGQQQRRENARALRAQGWSLAQIGAHLGVSKQRVHQILG